MGASIEARCTRTGFDSSDSMSRCHCTHLKYRAQQQNNGDGFLCDRL